MVRTILLWVAAALVVAVIVLVAVYLRDINRAYARVQAQGIVIASPYGTIEYTEGGSGPVVLVIHGSGGGYDQGELIAQTVLDERLHWITPSRFGYLRSALPDHATWDDQAHAYAYLLDQLGIEKVAVVAMSQGGPSALLFAVLHPQRVASLTLISCGVAPAANQNQTQADEKGSMLTTIFKYDPAYWVVSRLFRRQLMGLMGADDAVIAGLTPAQLALFERFIDEMNPVAPRSAGVVFDNRSTLPGERIATITAPTLILHAMDDTLQLYRNAEFAAATIPNARLIRFDRGGHFLIGVEQAAVGAAVREHIFSQRSR